jgi:hypothetical protein
MLIDEPATGPPAAANPITLSEQELGPAGSPQAAGLVGSPQAAGLAGSLQAAGPRPEETGDPHNLDTGRLLNVGTHQPGVRFTPAASRPAVAGQRAADGTRFTARSSAWRERSLRRISTARLARPPREQLSPREAVWRAALGDGYASLRHRCAPRAALRSRGLSDLPRVDPACRAAVPTRLERWAISRGTLTGLPRELEAVLAHVPTPARLA